MITRLIFIAALVTITGIVLIAYSEGERVARNATQNSKRLGVIGVVLALTGGVVLAVLILNVIYTTLI